MNVTFKAHFVKEVPIRIAANNATAKASIVELDTSSTGNMRTINRVANRFQAALADRPNEYNYANDARSRFNSIYNIPARKSYEHFYLLTTEKVNKKEEFDTMDPDKVIGVAQVNNSPDESMCELRYFNVDPATNYRAKQRKYIDVGRRFLQGIEHTVAKSICGQFDDKALGFYLKLGYEAVSRNEIVHKCINGVFTSPSE